MGLKQTSFNSSTNEYYYDGMMTEARVWSVARTASEILANYNTALTGNETNLDIYYNFSEGSGATLNDLSSVGYDGTIFGATWVTDNAPITSCSLSVNAGADQTVCSGDQITLNAPETDLFISEYSEGSSNNKYIEIFNGTGSDVDLSNYEMWKIANGGSWPEYSLSLSGTLAAGEVYVIYNGSSAATISSAGDIVWSQANYNGDDAIGLAKSISGTMTLIDAVGTDGADPGSGWSVAGVNNATKDHTLVRKSSVTGPNANWTASAGTNTTDSEWEVLAKDDWTNIGLHSSVLPITYSWDNSVTNGTAFTPTATTTYTVTGTDANGCIATDQLVVTVNTLPTATVNNEAICDGGSAATFTATSATAVSWLWSDNGTGTSQTTTGTTAGDYTVVVTDAQGCESAPATGILTVNALPTVSAGADQTACPGTSVTLSGSGASTYAWDNSITNGTAFTPIATTTYNVTGTDANGCTATDQVVVNVNTLPTVSAGADQAVCDGGAVTLSGSGATTYAWNNGVSDGVAFIPNSNPSNLTIGDSYQGGVIVYILQSGDPGYVSTEFKGLIAANSDQSTGLQWYNGSYITTGANATDLGTGLSNTNAIIASQGGNPGSYSYAAGICSDYSVNEGGVTYDDWYLPSKDELQKMYDNKGTGLLNIGNNNYWSSSETNSSNAYRINFINGFSYATNKNWVLGYVRAVRSFTPTATYTVIGTDGNGCTGTDQVLVTINALPTVTVNDAVICTGDAAATFTATSSTATSWLWSGQGTGTSATTTGATTGAYSVVVTDANGCQSASASGNLTVNALPTLQLELIKLFVMDDAVTLSGSGASTYAWDNGVTDGTAFTPTATATYTVTGTDANGCTATDQVDVTVNTLPTVSAGLILFVMVVL